MAKTKRCLEGANIPYLDKQKAKEAQKRWYDKNRDKLTAAKREKYALTGDTRKQTNILYAQNNKEKYIYLTLRNRAKQRNLPFDLEESDIQLLDRCPVFNISLVHGVGKGTRSRYAHSIDRIDPTKGYVKGNIQVLSVKANIMKSDATPEELLKFADWIYATYKKEE